MKGIDINMPIKGQFNYFKHFYLYKDITTAYRARFLLRFIPLYEK